VRVLLNEAVITITEGKNRQVRKMFEAAGLRVTHLKRISIGKLTLGNLQLGEWRYLESDEVKSFAKSPKT
jgi:pseudouridine synthase